MKAMQVRAPGGLDRIERSLRPDYGARRPGQGLVHLHAEPLNSHDYAVVTGSKTEYARNRRSGGLSGAVSTALPMSRQARVQGITVGNRRHQIDMIRAIAATGIRR